MGLKEIESVEIEPNNLEIANRDDKLYIVDVLCKDRDGRQFVVEMQRAKQKAFRKRWLMYWSKLHSSQSCYYDELMPVIVIIAITDHNLFESKDFVTEISLKCTHSDITQYGL